MEDQPMSKDTTDRLPFWPWQVWRHFRTKLRNMEVRHARERAALTAWEIECWHLPTGESAWLIPRRPFRHQIM